MEEAEDSRTAIFERKRAHDVATRDDDSKVGSATSTPRKRVKHARKLSHQDVRDFVPVGGSFSTSAVPVDEAQSSDNGSLQVESSESAESDEADTRELANGQEDDAAGAAVSEGRRLYIGNLSDLATEADVKHLFRGYVMYVPISTSGQNLIYRIEWTARTLPSAIKRPRTSKHKEVHQTRILLQEAIL